MVGALGSAFGHFNHKVFGFIGYIYPFMMIFPAYLIYKESKITKELSHFMMLGGLMFFAMLLFQAKVFSPTLDGAFGATINRFLKSYIGDIGIWLFIISTISLSTTLMLNGTFEDVTNAFRIRRWFDEFVDKVDSFLFPPEREYVDIDNEFITKEPKRKVVAKDSLDSEKLYKKDHSSYDNDLSLDTISDLNQLLSSSNSRSSEDIDLTIDTDDKEDNLTKLKRESVNILDSNPAPKVKPKKESKVKNSTTVVKVLQENETLLEKQIEKGKIKKPKNFKLPYIDYLKAPPKRKNQINENEIDQKIQDLLEKLKQFKIEGDVVRTYSGPVVTTFEFRPAAHIKVSKILTLQDDLAMALKAETIRIQAPIPGKDVVGIEIPNKEIETIYLREVLESKLFKSASSPLTLAIGKDIVGNPFITDLKKLPHLLIAGTTGSGKSVGVNAMLVSLLYRNSPDNLKLLMIDPKMLEFSIYNDIPHLLTPVITQPKQAIIALANMVTEMEKRYKLMSNTKTKNIENYNEKAKKEGREEFPYIVIIIDELADLMMTSGKDVEFYIARLAQMARASGIHLIVATQRPSVDVVTGLIKANLPSRISFKVGQKIDSKIILDTQGAESLLGRGDMLFTPPGSSSIIRLHAPFVTEEEIEQIVEFLKVQREVVYDPTYLSEGDDGASNSSNSKSSSANGGAFDELFEEAKNVVLTDKKTSISYLQRRLQIGYNRSATIIEQLEMAGVLSAPNTKGQREILI
jgi:S-DNA-T family DNA segregation ATPase FtsK/SpoIIIE